MKMMTRMMTKNQSLQTLKRLTTRWRAQRQPQAPVVGLEPVVLQQLHEVDG